MAKKRHPLLTKISLLSASLLIVSGGAIAGNIPEISQTYPEVSLVFIEMLVTIPSLFVILTVLLSPKLAGKIGYKTSLLVGIGLVLLMGILPVFLRSFQLLLLSRIFFGVGIGLINPLLYSFASQLYRGRELATVIGFQSAFEGIGGMLATLTVGQLMIFGWRTSLLVYGMALPIFVLFLLFVPEIMPPVLATHKLVPEKGKIPRSSETNFTQLVGLLLILVIIYMSLSFKIGSFLQTANLGAGTQASNFLALIGAGAMVAGFFFGKLFTWLGQRIVSLSIAGMAAMLILLAFSNTLWLVYLCGGMTGFFFRLFVPYVFNSVNQAKFNQEKRTAILLITFNLGAALSPIVIGALQAVLPAITNNRLFLFEGILLGCLLGIRLCQKKFSEILGNRSLKLRSNPKARDDC